MPGICSIEGCGRPTVGQGFCMRHYSQWRRTGSPTGSLRAMKPTHQCDQCPYGGCDHLHEAHGLCEACYTRQRYRQQQGQSDAPLDEYLPNASQKLTADDRTALRAWYAREKANGLRMLDIAEHYGVTKGRIAQIIRSDEPLLA